MKESVLELSGLSMMPVNETVIALRDEMLIMDSLEHPVSSLDLDAGERFPMKLPMSCMMIVERGEVRYRINFREHVAVAGMCALICEGTIIDNVSFCDDARVIQLMFSQQKIAVSQSGAHRLYDLQEEHITMLKSLYGMLRAILLDTIYASNRDHAAAACIRFMGSLVSQDAAHNTTIKKKSSRRDEIVANFLDCVKENYREHRELGFYAEQLSLSLKYMSQVIFDQTGRHPSQWIKDYVILDAKTMLRSGRYTVQQVADELHFPNQSFFGKYFKEAVGVSPKKWK